MASRVAVLARRRPQWPMADNATVVALVALAILICGCGGGGDKSTTGKERPVTVWVLESEPDRLRATEDNVAEFTRATSVEVDLVGIGDDELADRLAEAEKTGRMPDVLQLPMASAHTLARDGTLSSDAAQDVVDKLGEQTFSARALSLLTSEGRVTAVPSDGWGQLLIYRRDILAKAGLGVPRTLEDVRRAARRLDREGMAGIAIPTVASPFTDETFEHVALAAGCRLLGDGGKPTLTSPQCRYAFGLYLDLARNYSAAGRQDVDTTRDVYFAGRAAMIFWSPFLLDAMA